MRARPVWHAVAPALLELAAVGVVALASCASDSDSRDSAGGSSEPTLTATASPSPSGGTPATHAAAPTLPASCGALLPDAEVVRALGQPLGGETTYLLDVPVPEIGRLGRVTCEYGVNVTATGARSTAVLDASVMLYVDAASANERVDVSIDDSRAKGDVVTPVQVRGQPGYAFENLERISVVGIDGARTVVVGMEANVLPAEQARQALITLANRILAGPSS